MGQHRISVCDTIESLLIKSSKCFDPRFGSFSVNKIVIKEEQPHYEGSHYEDCVQYYPEM